MNKKQEETLEEYKAKLRYHYKEIDEISKKIKIIQSLTCAQCTCSQFTGSKVLPKGWI